MRRMIALELCLGLVFLGVSFTTTAAKRAALVIGNSIYESTAALRGPKDVANLMDLKWSGFKTKKKYTAGFRVTKVQTMDQGAQELMELHTRIESMDGKTRALAKFLVRVVPINKVFVDNFDDYPEPIRLGLVFGFVDAAAKLNEMKLLELAPALPLILGKMLNLKNPITTIDIDSYEVGLDLLAKGDDHFKRAMQVAGKDAWIALPETFSDKEYSTPPAFRTFYRALVQLSEEDKIKIPVPIRANPFEALKIIEMLSRE